MKHSLLLLLLPFVRVSPNEHSDFTPGPALPAGQQVGQQQSQTWGAEKKTPERMRKPAAMQEPWKCKNRMTEMTADLRRQTASTRRWSSSPASSETLWSAEAEAPAQWRQTLQGTGMCLHQLKAFEGADFHNNTVITLIHTCSACLNDWRGRGGGVYVLWSCIETWIH